MTEIEALQAKIAELEENLTNFKNGQEAEIVKRVQAETQALLAQEQAKVNDEAKENIRVFAEFIEEYGEKVDLLNFHLKAAKFNSNIREVINPESGFFTTKLSDKLNESLTSEFSNMVRVAFGKAGAGPKEQEQSQDMVQQIVSTVNGAMELPGIGKAINSNPYGAIVKEAISTTSGLVLMISNAIRQGKQNKVLREFYSYLPNVQKNIMTQVNGYLAFYAETNEYNRTYRRGLEGIVAEYNVLNSRTKDLCISINTALKNNGVDVEPLGEKCNINDVTNRMRAILEAALDDTKIEPILVKLSDLIKTQTLELYQRYITLLEEKCQLEEAFLNSFIELFETYKSQTDQEKVEAVKVEGTEYLNEERSQIQKNKNNFKPLLKKIYF